MSDFKCNLSEILLGALAWCKQLVACNLICCPRRNEKLKCFDVDRVECCRQKKFGCNWKGNFTGKLEWDDLKVAAN